jgi:hypothetical protein
VPAPPSAAVGEARFFALADAGVIAAETRNYVPQLIAAALVAKEAARYGIACAARRRSRTTRCACPGSRRWPRWPPPPARRAPSSSTSTRTCCAA